MPREIYEHTYSQQITLQAVHKIYHHCTLRVIKHSYEVQNRPWKSETIELFPQTCEWQAQNYSFGPSLGLYVR